MCIPQPFFSLVRWLMIVMLILSGWWFPMFENECSIKNEAILRILKQLYSEPKKSDALVGRVNTSTHIANEFWHLYGRNLKFSVFLNSELTFYRLQLTVKSIVIHISVSNLCSNIQKLFENRIQLWHMQFFCETNFWK
jgi:hypothetical protein